MLMSVVYFITKDTSYVQLTAIIEIFLFFSFFVYTAYHMKTESKDLEQDDYARLVEQYLSAGVSVVIVLLTAGITYLIALRH